ncbi:MAG: hypothetical protein EA383_00470 [Spirochaetaceae bacterium]|nr:MAG: hypothetical protein EA383_00470 [Spirochaetaceae bacterium]
MTTPDRQNRLRAALLGSVTGDAIGVPVEFSSREERRRDPVQNMRAYGTHHQPAGTWSDDSSMLLCLAESITETGWNLEDQMSRYAKWLTEAYMTPHGKVFDVGGATRAAIGRFEAGTEAVLCGGRDERDNGNGSLMRCLPAALYFGESPDEILARAMDQSSRLTHAHPRSRLACVFIGLLLSELWRRTGTEARISGTEDGFPGEESADATETPAVMAAPAAGTAVQALAAASQRLEALAVSGSLPEELTGELPSLARLRSGSLHTLHEREIPSSGYVIDTIEAAVWCLCTTTSYRDCVLAAVNLGEDTDTTACVAGGLSGLLWGPESIPDEWAATIAGYERVRELTAAFARVTVSSVPFGNAYTVLPGKLVAGQYPRNVDDVSSRAKIAGLFDAGVTRCIDLTEENEHGLKPYAAMLEETARTRGAQCGHTRFAIPDMGVCSEDRLRDIHAAIDSALQAGETVYVHCWGGHGRTGLVIGTWLVSHGLADPTAAVETLRTLRKRMPKGGHDSPETRDQIGMLTKWSHRYSGSGSQSSAEPR